MVHMLELKCLSPIIIGERVCSGLLSIFVFQKAFKAKKKSILTVGKNRSHSVCLSVVCSYYTHNVIIVKKQNHS